MTGLRVTHRIDKLAADMASIPARASVDMRETVREGIQVGNTVAKDFARQTSGAHARKYPGTFSARMLKSYAGFGSIVHQGEYGPFPSGQGLLAGVLENGTRKNKPHLNLARSADLMGPALAGEVRRLPDRWFW